MDIRNFKKFRNELIFIPLGGSNEIGLNCNLYHLDGKWLIVDCGIGFTKMIPGVDLVVPDVSVLKKIQDNIVGLVITHIHEDHLGAIQYLWEDLKCPIYTSRFTKAFLMEKLKEYDFYNEVKIYEVNDGDKVKLDPFELEFIGLTHSCPDMNAVLIKTYRGNVFHTGDWKFDEHPIIGDKSNIKRLKKLGANHEVLALTCESTNIFSEGDSKSESELVDSLNNIISTKTNLVVVATFASNLGRVKTLMDIAKKNGREVYLMGNSLNRIFNVAKEIGYLNEDYHILDEEGLKQTKKKNLMIIATGCQGEENAGLDKLCSNMSKYIFLKKDDCVIFSSKTIPGNEKDLMYIYNKLAEMDVEVITADNYFTHVSGHYKKNDLLKMYSYVKPKMLIAVHGEPIHLMEQQRVAKENGILQTIKGKNGSVIRITEDKLEKVGQVELQGIVVDGKRLLSTKDDILRQRRKLLEAGALFINFVISDTYKLLTNPVVVCPGSYNLEEDKVIEEIFKEDLTSCYNKSIKNIAGFLAGGRNSKTKQKFSTDEQKEFYLEQQIRTCVYKIYDEDLGKRPALYVVFTKIKNNTEKVNKNEIVEEKLEKPEKPKRKTIKLKTEHEVLDVL